ncbi:MAG: hypothetical protein M1816_000622 [Peltula sp. TS41687]|nr:MAG: hypothetical protein M1816_000622 [Peltula sp. TS41687]
MQGRNSPALGSQSSSGVEPVSDQIGSAAQQAILQTTSSHSDRMDSVQSSMTETSDRAGVVSPPSPISSRTPPPSTQAPLRKPSSSRRQNKHTQQMRTPSPPAPVLSSPPPTIQTLSMREPDRLSEHSYTTPTAEQIGQASSAELRSFMEKAALEIVQLNQSLHKSRTTAAHYRLQNNLLSYEAEEASKRMAVEYEMMRREMDVLQKLRGREIKSQPEEPSQASYLTLELKRQCQSLQSEKALLRRRLGRAKKVIRMRDGQVTSLLAESDRLKTRIKENRENYDRLVKRGVSYSGSTPQNPQFQTPTIQRTTSRPTRDSVTTPYSAGPGNGGGEDTFAALLLADQVLSQEEASARSTPAQPRPSTRPTHHLGHTRATQSLSSLPSTPGQFPLTSLKTTETPFGTRLTEISELHQPIVKTPSPPAVPLHRRDCEDSDTTISAPEEEGEQEQEEVTKPVDQRRRSTAAAKKGSNDVVIQESQASQLATHMLRRPATAISRNGRGGATAASAKGSSPSTPTKLPASGRGSKRASVTRGPSSIEVGTTRTSTKRAGPGPGAGEHVEEGASRTSKRVKTAKGAAAGVGLGINGLGR